jgi:putative membrane-bound dehydrogenase-like protein
MKPYINKTLLWILSIPFFFFSCHKSATNTSILKTVLDQENGTISVFRGNEKEPILVQNAKPDFRPFLHPIAAPDGKGLLTEYSPGHHKHQTGLYWGFTRVNGEPIAQDSVKSWFYRKDKTDEQKAQLGRDFFHNPGEGFWKRQRFSVIDSIGESVKWQTVYHMLDAEGNPIMEETQTWSLEQNNGDFNIDLEWQGKAIEEITIGEYEYGGLFLRMPWKEGIKGQVVNFARQINERGEGQRALWVDAGMQVEGREDLAHVAIFDHPENAGFPQTWRVDNQLGIGPVRARMGDWKILKGETETIKHRLHIYTGELNDLELTEKWKEYIGDDNLYATAGLWDIARKEGRDAKFLTAQEAVEAMTIKDDYQVNAWAAEPLITQPMAFCWDDKGRLWVAENRDYETRKTGFSAFGDSRIVILEDTDGDGQADNRKVFAEGIPFPSALAVGFGGVYVGAPPNLLFIPDKNEDDKADTKDIEVLLTGWGIRDRHETINSLHWGPDGWLYGLEGFATPSKIRKPVGKGKLYKHRDAFPDVLLEKEGVDINGGVWRFHPTKKEFEAVAHGFSNPWGIDYDAKGQLFISACVIPHMFHVIPGGIYHRQGGQHFSPYVYDDIKTIVDHRHRSAHGGARIYLSDAFPEEQRGRLFMANIHEHAVLSDILKPKGSGFVASHGEDFMMANNAQWIGFSMEIGPEGGLYVLDWHDADICGEDVVHKETGRIYRITPKKSLAENWAGRYDDLNSKSDIVLAQLQTSKSVWHARRARLILQYRASKGKINAAAVAHLKGLFAKGNVDNRLRAMWALHVTQSLSETELSKALNDNEEYIRAWAVQLLSENKNASDKVLSQFEKMAEVEKSAVVRMYLASSLQRMPLNKRWPIGANLMAHSEDQNDHNIPKMLWFGMEPAIATDIKKGLALTSNSNIPLLVEYISRRAVDADAVSEIIELAQHSSKNQLSLLKGLQAELENRTDIQAPKNWSAAYQKLKANKGTADIALEIAQQFGDLEASNKMMALLHDKNASVEQRKSALNGLANRQWKGLRAELPNLVEDKNLSLDAIRAIAQFDDNDLGGMLFNKYKNFNQKEKSEAVLTLASRRVYANILVNAIKNKQIPKSDIPAFVARQLRRVMGNGFVEIWGPIDNISENLDEDYAKYNALLNPKSLANADVKSGKEGFGKTCGACHQMYGEGGTIGPDITGSNRTNLTYLLTNILEPNAVIQDEYKMMVLTMRDGRTYLGNVVSETDRQFVLKVVGQDRVTINKSEIQSQEETPNSMMPSGLLNNMTDKEVIDLVAYLQTKAKIK